MKNHPSGAYRALVFALLATTIGCNTDPDIGKHGEAQIAPDAKLDLDGINLDEEPCDCADAQLKNLQQKLIEAQVLFDAAKNSVTETQGYLETVNTNIIAERLALNEVTATDISLYTGIVMDAASLALDVAVPSSALVRRTACNLGKKAANVYIKKALATVVKRTTIVSPTRKALRRVGIARVIEGQNNGVTEVMTWIPVVGPVVEMMEKFQGLKKRDELMALRRENLNSLVAEYDETDALLQKVMAEANGYEAEVANLMNKILSFNRVSAICESLNNDPSALGELGINPDWPKGWGDVFHIPVKPKPVECTDGWIKFTGSSRLSRFWGSRDAVNAARAHAEEMCFNNPVGQNPNLSCEAPRTQQRSAFFDFGGGPNPSGNRQGAGCGAPRFFGSSTAWSDPLTEIDCWCYRKTCCGLGAEVVEVKAVAAPALN